MTLKAQYNFIVINRDLEFPADFAPQLKGLSNIVVTELDNGDIHVTVPLIHPQIIDVTPTITSAKDASHLAGIMEIRKKTASGVDIVTSNLFINKNFFLPFLKRITLPVITYYKLLFF